MTIWLGAINAPFCYLRTSWKREELSPFRSYFIVPECCFSWFFPCVSGCYDIGAIFAIGSMLYPSSNLWFVCTSPLWEAFSFVAFTLLLVIRGVGVQRPCVSTLYSSSFLNSLDVSAFLLHIKCTCCRHFERWFGLRRYRMREMQLKIETLEELQSEDDELNARSLDKILSRYSSLDSLNQVTNFWCFWVWIVMKYIGFLT
jgi:hypothetical protein